MLSPTDPFETDPRQISLLWTEVLSTKVDAATPEEGQGRITRSKGKAMKSQSSTSDSVLIEDPALSEISASASTSKRGKKPQAKVSDDDFAQTVLEPYAITIQRERWNRKLRKFFDILNLPEDDQTRLQVYKDRLPSVSVWLNPSKSAVQAIQIQYHALQVHKANEAEHSTYALRSIFLDEPRQPYLPEDLEDKALLPVQLLQHYQKPGEGEQNWESPPCLSTSPPPKEYAWDIRPDCAYYVSLQAFKAEVRPNIHNMVSVRGLRAVCAYFSIEFEKDAEANTTAERQVAIAAALSLFNRWNLKKDAIEASQREWNDQDHFHLRHFGLTFTGPAWVLWCMTPKSYETWSGCTMSNLFSGHCTSTSSVSQLIAIINDVHYWGLHAHGGAIKRDIREQLKYDEYADIGDLTLLDDE